MWLTLEGWQELASSRTLNGEDLQGSMSILKCFYLQNQTQEGVNKTKLQDLMIYIGSRSITNVASLSYDARK